MPGTLDLLKHRNRHFTNEEWSDYVRGLAPEQTRHAIDGHLEQNCQKCRTENRLWGAVLGAARREALNQVPPDVVRTGQAAFINWRREMLPTRATLARIVFDSLLQAAPVGVRGNAETPRRIVGRSGHWLVDVRLEQLPGRRLSIAGQVFKPARNPTDLLSIEISMVSRKVVLSSTTPNRFGEFQLQGHSANDLRLYIDVPGRRPIAVPLMKAEEV